MTRTFAVDGTLACLAHDDQCFPVDEKSQAMFDGVVCFAKTPTLACSVDLVGLLDQVHVACNNAGRDQSPNGVGRLIIGSNLMTLWFGSLSREFAN